MWRLKDLSEQSGRQFGRLYFILCINKYIFLLEPQLLLPSQVFYMYAVYIFMVCLYSGLMGNLICYYLVKYIMILFYALLSLRALAWPRKCLTAKTIHYNNTIIRVLGPVYTRKSPMKVLNYFSFRKVGLRMLVVM